MKRALPVVIILFRLGGSFPIAQGVTVLSPFDRYLAGLRTGHHEAALLRTASRCGVDLNTAVVRNAVRPEETWKLVKSLAYARDAQETDFLATAQVWQTGNRVLLEEWNSDFEVGDEIRTLYCLQNRQIVYGEQIEWSSDWAYEVRWKVMQGKFFKSINEGFVNDQEKRVPKPKLGPEAPKVFGIIPEMRTWADLKLPSKMLQ